MSGFARADSLLGTPPPVKFPRLVPPGQKDSDQLLLLVAIAGGREFLTVRPSLHTETQMALVPRLLPVHVRALEEGPDRFRIVVERS